MRPFRLPPFAVDAAVALGVAVVQVTSAALTGSQDDEAALTLAGAAILVAQAAVLLVRRRWPVPVLLVCGALTGAYGISPEPDPLLYLALLVALFTVVARCSTRVVVASVAATVVAGSMSIAATGDSDVIDVYAAAVSALLAGVLGALWRTRQAYLDELEQRAVDLAARRDEQARQAVLDERARIARELHDVVAHHVTMMVVQAEAGAATATPPDVEVLDRIASTGRDATTELRRMLGLLRSATDDTDAPLAPQPDVSQLEALADEVRATGLEVRLSVDDDVADLGPATGLSVYRIVQEALTNTVRHASASTVNVSVRRAGGSVVVEVQDDGRGAAVDADAGAGPGGGTGGGGGHGLVGIAERVALHNGTLSTGTVNGSGFRVRAELPIGTR